MVGSSLANFEFDYMYTTWRIEMTPKRIVLLVLGFLFAIFVVQNAEVVQLRFLFWSTQASRALVLVGTFVLGLVIGWMSAWLLKKEQPLAKEDIP